MKVTKRGRKKKKALERLLLGMVPKHQQVKSHDYSFWMDEGDVKTKDYEHRKGSKGKGGKIKYERH